MSTKLQYDLLMPRRIVFGRGRRREVGKHGRTLGRRAFLFLGLRREAVGKPFDEILDALQAEGIEVVHLAHLQHEPEVADVDHAAELMRSHHAGQGDFVIAVGGGAAIDLAKAAAAMAVNDESSSVKDYLENVGRDLKIKTQPLPILAMPSTAGTGAEATKNAVISSYDPPFKKSLRDDRLMPSIALVDPELTVTVPPAVTAASGMDAITQLIESYISRKSQPIPRVLALQGLCMAIPAIAEAVENGRSQEAREAMSHAALLSGIALANSGLGMAHGVAAALGTHCRIRHGVACALMLPAAIRVNMECCLMEFAMLGRMLFRGQSKDLPTREFLGYDRDSTPAVESRCDLSEETRADAMAFLNGIEDLCRRVGVPHRLSQVGVGHKHISGLVQGARGSSMSGNPRELSDDELTAILEELL